MKRTLLFSLMMLMILTGLSFAADTVPPVIDLPGTQPGEVGNLESPDKCDNCHGGYNPSVEPAHNWRGSMMGNAGRDPIFWATLAVAEQDFDGAGDLCIRCHSTAGWIAGRSTPTDGSGLASTGDDDGVECDYCHKMTRPDDTQLLGEQLNFFPANDPLTSEGFYGSGMGSLWGGNEKLGPYIDAEARHQFLKNPFIRDPEFCGTCHDVSNSAVGHFAPNFGAQTPENVVTDGPRTHSSPDHIVGTNQAYVALNNPPYAYGVVERTFSEHMSSDVPLTEVKNFATLPADLQDGSFKAIYESALVAGTNGDYADGQTRFYTCQSCHLRPVNGPGCNKAGVPIRTDLALHDLTGGNYWMGEAIKYQDAQGTIRLGGGLSATQIAAIDDGMTRAKKQLNQAASLEVTGNTLKVTNLTGHKVITGYPEGRRMWLNIKWYDGINELPIRVDGAYNTIDVTHRGQPLQVATLLDLHDTNTKVYEAHYGMTQDWANALMSLGYPSDFVLGFDRLTGEVNYTLGMLNAAAPGSAHETFHFVLNNAVLKDNRIPPYRMRYDDAKLRNALPVPAEQYGGGTPGSVYNYFDNFTLNPPAGAAYATIDLLYQPTSWEYIQFLDLANNQQNAFLGQEGVNMLDAWLNTGMAAPYTMVSTVWGTPPTPTVTAMTVDSLSTWSVDKKGNLVAESSTFNKRDTVAVVALVVDEAGAPLSGAQVFVEILTDAGALKIDLQGFTDATGTAILNWKTSRTDIGTYTANVNTVLKNGYEFSPVGSVVQTAPFVVQ